MRLEFIPKKESIKCKICGKEFKDGYCKEAKLLITREIQLAQHIIEDHRKE